MKKDIEWLKKEIGTEMIELEPNRAERWSDVKYQTLRSVAQKIYQLDEPEVLSQDWIRNNQERKGVHFFVNVTKLQNLAVPKKELPVIPKYVAEWIIRHRDIFDLYPALRRLEGNSLTWDQIYKWYRENTHKFVNAYLTGEYKVEEELLYYALIKGHELSSDVFKYWNCKAYNSGELLIGSKYPKASCINRMTKNNWNKLGINDSNADFVNVEN